MPGSATLWRNVLITAEWRSGFWLTDLADFLDDDEELGDGEGRAEVVGGSDPWVTGGAGGANK